MSLHEQIAEYIKGYEGYSPTAYWDVNAYRIGYGSDTITTSSSGSYRKVVKGDVTNKEMATLDLQRRIRGEFEPTVKRQVPNYDSLPENTKIALVDFAYNYGSLQPDVRNAALSGDSTRIASAISLHESDNASVNKKRRQGEQGLILTAVKKSVAYAKGHKGLLLVAAGSLIGLSYIVYKLSKSK